MTDTLTITADGQRTTTAHINRTTTSDWTHLLTSTHEPDDHALDTVEALIQEPNLNTLTIEGCPAHALLPILWVRSVFAKGQGPTLVIKWTSPTTPDDERQQLAGRLACALADRVDCNNPSAAASAWGFDPLAAPPQGEPFDLLGGLIDLWDSDLHLARAASDWDEALRKAISACCARGATSIAIYGAGTHTRACAEALMEPPAHITIIDDDPRRHGQTLWGYTIQSPDHALNQHVDAVILSANSIEDVLWQRAEPFRNAGIPVIRLYSTPPKAH